MNIAFEISPLLLASGTFGDKSGVYRYYYGLIRAYGEYIKKNHKNDRIILFSFNRDLTSLPPSKDIIDLLENKVFISINQITPIKRNFSLMKIKIFDSILRPILKIINLIIPIKKIYQNFINEVNFQEYLLFLKKKLNNNQVSIIYHSETSFYPLKEYKNVITIYDLTPIIMSSFHRQETVDLTQRKLYFTQKHCQGIVCISKSTKNDLLKHYPLNKNKKILICYPGNELSSPSTKENLFRDINMIIHKQASQIKKDRYLLFYGTFEPRKNITNLVEAFFDLQKKLEIPKDFKLVLMGGEGWGEKKKLIKNFVKENYPLKEKNNIVIIDFLNDDYLTTLIKNAYAVVYPSLYEGFGLPVLESLTLGTPVICSNNSSLPEVGGDAVLYVTPNNFYDLKNKIKYLINHPKVANILSKRGLKQSKKFNRIKSAAQLNSFLNSL